MYDRLRDTFNSFDFNRDFPIGMSHAHTSSTLNSLFNFVCNELFLSTISQHENFRLCHLFSLTSLSYLIPTPRAFVGKNAMGLVKKVGYTAISCGRVGRGGNARFPTFDSIITDQRTNGLTNGQTDGQSLLLSCVSATKKK